MAGEFSVHRLNSNGLAKADTLAAAFAACLAAVSEYLGPGRELALVVTKLQEACFYAKRGIALQPFNRVEED
jgi:hypothetical protein